MTFKKTNNLAGWVVFSIALVTYYLTREARGSLWDCGEFVSCAAKLELPHPPGAPLFTLLGRFFIILFGDRPDTIASAVNFMSALASAATILFLFWTITHFAGKLVRNEQREIEPGHWWTVIGAGAVGALAYTFSDSFWFSAVEGEVYALSSFFTALVFWAILKWEQADERAGNDATARLRSDRWIVLLFFMMGLSIGVHLLNLLTIPAIVMVYYYRRFNVSLLGAILAFVISCILTGIVQVGVIQYSMKAAGLFDVYFVNNLKLPFFSGFAFYFIAISILIILGISYNPQKINKAKVIGWTAAFLILFLIPYIFEKNESDIASFIMIVKLLLVGALSFFAFFINTKSLQAIRLTLWCFAFMLLGYFMYFTTLIRSSANPPIDMNNVDNPISLVDYLSREQYGSAPLIYGAHFAARGPVRNSDGTIDYRDVNPIEPYIKGPQKYIKTEKNYSLQDGSGEYNWNRNVKMLFPRVWDASNDQGHADFYADWLGLYRDPISGEYDAPKFRDNMNWFFSYQMSFMYWRYFMWNFAGKQNDIQGLGNFSYGNWITGIKFADDKRLGDQSKLPQSIQNNKANNKLYLLPFLLGILGCVYQFIKNQKDWLVSFLLFFFTGIAIVLYLNQPGNQPRERDYAYVGSFYAFAIWIGLSIVALVQMARSKKIEEILLPVLGGGSVLSFLIVFMSCFPGPGKKALIMGAIAAIMFAVIFAVCAFIIRAVSQNGNKLVPAAALASLLGLGVPALMAQQEWDDHDRSQKTTAPDLGKDYLESCPPNAILFTFGDNDTYSLWYAQEVENVRPDVRVINTSLLQSDYYINQLRYKVNLSDSMDVIFSPDQIAGMNLYMTDYVARPEISPSSYYDLEKVLRRFVATNNPELPVRNLSIPVDTSLVRNSVWINPDDSILTEMKFTLTNEGLSLSRSDMTILSVTATNKWKRPICFTSPYSKFGWGPYFRKNGLVYQLTPVANRFNNSAWELENSMRAGRLWGSGVGNMNLTFTEKALSTRFKLAGAERPGVYYDEENRRHLLHIRGIYAEAAGNLADAGKMESAGKLLDLIDKGMLESNIPYAMASRDNQHNQTGLLVLEAAYKANKLEMAKRIGNALRTDLTQQKSYQSYNQEFTGYTPEFDRDAIINEVMLMALDNIEAQEMIELLWEITKEINAETAKGKDLRLTDAEKVFYGQIDASTSVKELMKDEKLVRFANELAQKIHNNKAIDWKVRQSVKERIKLEVKALLK